MPSVLQLSGVSQGFRAGGQHHEILRGIDLEVAAGEVVWLRGASGSGKTTLLSVAGLLARPTAGTVRIGGTDYSTAGSRPRTAARARSVGIVFQHHNLLLGMTAADNVALPALASAAVGRARAHELLDTLGLRARADFRAHLLSGGERQRVAVARALVNDPQMVIADEPISGLDPEAAACVLAQLKDAGRAEGRAVLVASHDRAVEDIADRVVSLTEGTLS